MVSDSTLLCKILIAEIEHRSVQITSIYTSSWMNGSSRANSQLDGRNDYIGGWYNMHLTISSTQPSPNLM